MSESDVPSKPARSHTSFLRRLRLGLIYFAALSLLMFWELRERVEFFADECDQVETSPHSALYTESYRLLHKWTSHPSSPIVSVIAIPSDLEEIRGNLCHARSYMADLLRSLAAQNPLVIVIDNFYGPAACAKPGREGGTGG